MDFKSQFSILNSVSRWAFFQPMAVLAAARYWGAATTYSLLSPKISNASSRIGRSSGKIGQLRIPRPSWCSTFGSGMLIRFSSQSMSSQRSDNVSEGVLGLTSEAKSLATELILRHGIPGSEPRDALHISLAAVHGIQFLVTWNFRHIANAETRATIEQICRDCGFNPPSICSPDELLGA